MNQAATIVPLRHLATDVRRAWPRLGGVRLICIDGPSGAGKTTLAERLARVLDQVIVVHLDDVYDGWDGLSTVADRLREWLLNPLRAGLPGGYHRYDWETGRYAEWHVILPDTAVVLLEGVGSLAAGADDAVLRLWLDAPADLRLRRGLERDGETYRPFWQQWAAAEQRHFAWYSSAEQADLWLDGAPDTAHDPENEVVVTGRA